MHEEPLDAVPLWLLFAGLCALSALALEGGYRFGRRRHTSSEEKATPVGAMVGSVVGLFAFLLAFTFGMAASRYEARRQAVLDEANAIGTTYLRTELLRDQKQRDESARLLREYVDLRVRATRDGNVHEAIARSEELHARLWAEATRAAESNPTPITSLYVQSLNQMIDVHSVRVQAGVRSRIPATIWAGLFALALLSMASVGYQCGISATRRSPEMMVLVLAFVGVMFLIADLDRPHEGSLTVSQQAMIDLQRSMNTPEHPK